MVGVRDRGEEVLSGEREKRPMPLFPIAGALLMGGLSSGREM